MNPASWKPAVMIWRWAEAPEEFKALSGFDPGTEQLVIYVPPELLDEDGEYEVDVRALWFLNWEPKQDEHGTPFIQSAGERWGEYLFFNLAGGGRILIARAESP